MDESAMWMCANCEYIYKLQDGDPDDSIPAGTIFGDIPEGWVYPICGADKSLFKP